MEYIRQGDLLFVPVSKIPEHAELSKRTKTGILVEGEATGHHHKVAVVEDAEVYEAWDGMFLKVSDQGVSIVHQEHGPVTLPAGAFEIHRAREYDYLAAVSRVVRD